MKYIKSQELKCKSWSGGTTTEIYIYPEDSVYANRNFDFRISTATVELETSDFTSLPDINRLIMSLDHPLELWHNGDYVHLDQYEVNAFKGEWQTSSKGKVKDFNVMFKDHVKATMLVQRDVEINNHHLLGLYALEDLIVGHVRISQGDFLLIEEKGSVNIKGLAVVIEIAYK